MYFDRSPLYSQRIITYKNWSTLRQSEFHKPIWNQLSVLHNNFVKIVQLFYGSRFFKSFLVRKENEWEFANKAQKNMCDIYVTEFFTSKNIVNQL